MERRRVVVLERVLQVLDGRDLEAHARRPDGRAAVASKIFSKMRAAGVAPVLVLNIGDLVMGGRFCLLADDPAAVDRKTRARPLVVPSDDSRAICVFADFGDRTHQCQGNPGVRGFWRASPDVIWSTKYEL